MGKRAAIISFIVLIAGMAVLGYFLQKGRRTYFTDPYKAISTSAAIIIETPDLQSFINSVTTGKGLTGEAGKVKEFGLLNRKLKYLADQMNKAPYQKISNRGPAIMSFHPSLPGRLELLSSMAVSPDLRTRQLKDILRQWGIKSINEIDNHGNKILEIPYTLERQNDTVYFSVVSGLMLCSSDRGLINDAISRIGTGEDIRSVPGFSKVLQASGKNEDKIFVIFRNLPNLFKPVFREEFVSYASEIGKLAGCSGGDIYFGDNGLVLSGYTESLDQRESLFKFKSGMAGTFHTYKILPSATIMFESLNKNAVTVSSNPGDSRAAKLALKLREYTGDEITRAIINIKGRPADDNTLIIYELKNKSYAEKIFLDDAGPDINKDNIYFFRPDDQINIPVFQTPFTGFASAVMPGFQKNFNDSWFAFYDNYMITGSSYVTISRLLYDNLLNKTLANDLAYRDFESTLPSIAGYYLYFVPSQIIDYLAPFLNENLTRSLRANKSSLDKIPAIGYQIVSSNNMIYNSLSIRFKEEARVESTTEWETLLDTIAAIKPFFFTNHLTGAKEIFIQDLNNNAYLINVAGRILWKVPLGERIKGNVYMIDYFRNGKYQLLFSSENYLHLIDRNGNYVERYPVRLRSRATNSLALFDYDNNRTYRLLIAGEDKMVYAYDKNGNVVKGWKPFRTSGNVKSEISWFRVSGKDYLVLADETSVYLLDRSGNIRLSLKESVTKAENSAIRLIPGSPSSLVCTAPDGTVQQIHFDGSVTRFSLRKLSVDHSFDFFDVNGDGFGEYIFIDKGIMYLYNHNRSEIFTKQFSSEKVGGPINFVFSSSDRKIGVIDINKNLIYLIDSNGDTMKGFPLKGASMFSIGKLSDKSGWHLIVGGTDRFLYNYKLDTEIK